MTETDTDTTADEPASTGTAVPPIVDWAVAVALFLGGALALLLGTLFFGFADRDAITQLVAEGTIRSDILTPSELVDVTYALAWWSGLGLLIVGALLVIAAIAFAYYRRQARRHGDTDRAASSTWPNAAIGAVVTIVTTVIPLSPIVGGAVAGYLEGGTGSDRARVGAYAGAIAAIPLVIVFLFLLGGFVVVATELSLGMAATIGIVGLAIGLVASVLYLVGLSALGGYLSLLLASDQSTI